MRGLKWIGADSQCGLDALALGGEGFVGQTKLKSLSLSTMLSVVQCEVASLLFDVLLGPQRAGRVRSRTGGATDQQTH